MDATRSVPIQASGKTLTILEALAAVEGAGVSTLAAELDMAKGTVHHHLQTLEAHELVVNEGGVYRISLRFLDFGERARKRTELHQIAQPEVEELATETGEIAYLMVPEHGKGVLLSYIHGDRSTHADLDVGMRVPLPESAPGKAILAVSRSDPATERDASEEATGLPPQLSMELEAIRRSGYATDTGGWQEGLWSLAAPIQIQDESVIGAVGIMVPADQLDTGRFDESIVETTTGAARLVEIKGSYL